MAMSKVDSFVHFLSLQIIEIHSSTSSNSNVFRVLGILSTNIHIEKFVSYHFDTFHVLSVFKRVARSSPLRKHDFCTSHVIGTSIIIKLSLYSNRYHRCLDTHIFKNKK